jgi:hypothetical protein
MWIQKYKTLERTALPPPNRRHGHPLKHCPSRSVVLLSIYEHGNGRDSGNADLVTLSDVHNP